MARRTWARIGVVVMLGLAIGACGFAKRGDASVRSGGVAGPLGNAGTRTWHRSSLPPHAVKVEVGDEETLPVRSLRVHAHVDGFRARVRLDLDFENVHERELEGTFALRLPDGAAPYFLAFGQHMVARRPATQAAVPPSLALDPAGILSDSAQPWVQPKEARMVERDLAAAAYRGTVRRQVDPAIAEWAGAGVFNTRLYPIAPSRMHRVVVGYDVDLTAVDGAAHLQLALPLDAAHRELEVDVASRDAVASLPGAGAPRVAGGRTVFVADNPSQATFELTVRGGQEDALRGSDPGAGDVFAARVLPDLPRAESRGSGRAVFALDVSMSSNPDQFNVWVDLLREVLRADPGIEEFAVLFFNVEAFWWQPRFVPNNAAELERLSGDLGPLALEGATDLGAALREATAPRWLETDAARDWDLFLLSDGAATWGQHDAEVFARQAERSLGGRLFAYRTGIGGGEPAVLARLARDTGGAVFSVGGAAEVQAASAAHRSQPWELLAVQAAGVSDVLVQGAPRFIYPGQALTVAGRIAAEDPSSIRVRVRQGQREHTAVVDVPATLRSELAPRVYGQIAVEQLEDEGARALQYARHFRVPRRSASLLMLEDWDYARHGITEASVEGDAAWVRRRPAGPRIRATRARRARTSGDPKRAFLAHVQRLQEKHDVALSDEAADYLNALPTEAFGVEDVALRCARHDRSVVPPTIQRGLQQHELEYDAVFSDARRRRAQLGAADGLKALSSLIEARPGDTVIARDVAYTAVEWGVAAHTTDLLRRLAHTRPEEPQTLHALAQNLAERGHHDLAAAYFELALSPSWDLRFGQFRTAVALDYLRLLRSVPARRFAQPSFIQWRRRKLEASAPVRGADLVVVIGWNTDATDVDLHVVEPSGEECFYGNRRTRRGGRITMDVTEGFGPEVYSIARAAKGPYRVFAHYYGDDANRLSTRTKVYATVYRNFGTPQEKVTRKAIPLGDGTERHAIEVVTF